MRLLSPVIAVGLAGAFSRVLGYGRDVLVANILGAGPAAEAFLAALRAPNAVRRILGDGGLNAVLTPLYLRLQIRHGGPAAAGFVRDALCLAAASMLVLSGLLAISAGAIIYATAPGLDDQPERFEAARWWLVLMTPFIGASTLGSIAGAFLNAGRRYFYAAFAPATVNLVLVFAYLAIPMVSADPNEIGSLMAISLSIAGFLQLGLTIAPLTPALKRCGYGWPSAVSLHYLGNALRLGTPALIATASFQIIGLVAAAAASWEPGGIVWFYYADRMFQLPLSLASGVIGSILLTELSARQIVRVGEVQSSSDDLLNPAVAFGVALGLPAAFALMILSQTIIDILFGHGAFTAKDTQSTALALMAMAPGLPAGIAGRILLQELFAREQSWLSMVCGATGILAAIVAAVLLTPLWGIAGASAAMAVGLWTQFIVLATVMIAKGWWMPRRALAVQLMAQFIASAIMAVAIVLLNRQLLETPLIQSTSIRICSLILVCIVGGCVYSVAVWLLRGLPEKRLSGPIV